ncbi:MAG: response regulator [Promethearchaeota archaeon]
MIIIAKIFIVDDDQNIVNLFEQFLRFKGHKIIAKAFNGVEALELYKTLQNIPDLILIDHRMPSKDGLETIKEMLSINPHSKIIFISADYSIRTKALEMGAIDFLEKPIDFTYLIKLIEKNTATHF